MTTVTAQLDKSLDMVLAEGHGTITIRVVVLEKGMAAAPATVDETPADAAADEVLPETDKRPVSGFLEESKRGRQCCVFLINGQRQHFWDNQFIVRDLELKYLRNRMIVVVDCDGLKPEAVAELMQGSRHQFYEGTVYSALESRVIATLKGDPDLRRLEEEAEDEISSLQAGDEAVKAALDQLIEAHHDAAPHIDHGHTQAGDAARDEGAPGSLIQTQDVVIEGASSVGKPAVEPVLNLRPDVATIRIKPNDDRRFLIYPKPETAWKALESMALTFDPPVKELQVTRTSQLTGEEVTLKFVEPDDFDEDEYPIETKMRSTAIFKSYPEPRVLERRVVITPGQKKPRKPVELKDDPTFIKVTSRQPIKILVAGPDVHVKMRWDGKDGLITGNPPQWAIKVTCDSRSVEPQTFLTKPEGGRFELLIQAAAGLKGGEQLKFDVEAIGPGKTLSTSFLADVVEPPQPRKISAKLPGGGQRRPPYDLRYVKKENWIEENCWGSAWTGAEPGAFEAPSKTSPLTIFINTDMDLLTTYRDSLLAKKLGETTIQQRINKYTAHVAFHLYQMYEKQKQAEKQPAGTTEARNDDQMRDEIQRVSRTLLKLMEVTQ
jgi:hypothetical protein